MALRDVIGQDRVITMLLGTLQQGRVSSSYLFTGESGIGKRLTALNLAKAINCLSRTDEPCINGSVNEGGKAHLINGQRLQVDACDMCRSCRKIDGGVHPDVKVITPERGEIRVDDIREIEASLSFRPYEGRKKIVIVDDADLMNPSASNAFLKTLEEPPEESHLILISPIPDKLPETIRSRCTRVHFKPLSRGDCSRVIENTITRRSPLPGLEAKVAGTSERQVQILAALVMGRPGLALSSDVMSERERFFNLLNNMLNGRGDAWSDRDEMERWLDNALIFLRDLAVCKITQDHTLLFNADMGNMLDEMCKRVTTTGIIELQRRVILLKREVGFNLNKAITWNYTASIVKKTFGGSHA
jgi:DNA polymerase III subunit delta'